MNNLKIDIETIPRQGLSDDLKPVFDETTVKLGNLKDPGKIADKIHNEEMKFNEGLTKKMSIQSDYCQILSLGYIETDAKGEELSRGVLFNEKDDLSIIKEFAKIYDGQTLVGWNSKSFDIPVIRKRAILNGLKNPFENYQRIIYKYSNDSIDLMHEWNGATEYGKMSQCAKLLGIDCKTGLDGSMIFDAWKNGDYKAIKDYNIQDCECCVEIYKKLFL